MRRKMTAVGILAASLVVALFAHAWAFPQYARQAKAACAACHVNPAGGADLTDAGKAYKADKKAPAAAAKAAEFMGVNKCKMCHFKQYKAWSETKHAAALTNLRKASTQACADMAAKLKVEVKGSPADNDACVVCHVTGFRLAGGYPATDSTKTAAVSGVTCEGCHGPGSLHVTAAAADKKKFINRAVSASLCTQCHTAATSPGFKFVEWKTKVHPVAAVAK
jgi:mono/diheme cytochrome c family protein